MTNERQQTLRDILVFTLLVAIGVAGRWGQPDWEFTPIAAAAVFAGFYFSRIAVAALVPLAILVVSDLRLPAYENAPELVIKYATMTVSVLFGRLLAERRGGWSAAWRWGVCGLAPATLFFVVTNFAVWVFQGLYPKTIAGLAQCYTAGVPFFRSMLAGDLVYLAAIFGCWALAVLWESSGASQTQAAAIARPGQPPLQRRPPAARR
jgi:hypothetical protein